MNYILELNDYWSCIKINEHSFKPSGAGAAAVDRENNIAYIFGGKDHLSPHQELVQFDMNSETFCMLDQLDIEPRFNHKLFYTKDHQLCILGGFRDLQDPHSMEYCDDIILVDLQSRSLHILLKETGKMRRGQFTSSLDYQNNILYVFGGFGSSDFFTVDLSSGKVTDINPAGDVLTSRAGMISEVLPDGRVFIFSGFSHIEQRPVCHQDYYIYDPKDNSIIRKFCNELLGRTFAKSFVCEEKKKVFFFGGTMNGMETSGALCFYDYEKDYFNTAFIEPLPGERVEPFVWFSPKNSKMYVLSGFRPFQKHLSPPINELFMLDFNRVGSNVI